MRCLADNFPWKKIYTKRGYLLRHLPSALTAPGAHWKRLLATVLASDKRWSMAPPSQTQVLLGHKKPVLQVQFLGNGLLSCDESMIREWNLDNGLAANSFAM